MYFVKNKKLFDPAIPGRQVKDPKREGQPDALDAWVDHVANWTQIAHFQKAQ